MLSAILLIIALFAAAAAGYLLGRKHEAEAQREAVEYLRRVDPPRRTAGAPANMEAPPSDVSRPKWRSGTFKSGPPHE